MKNIIDHICTLWHELFFWGGCGGLQVSNLKTEKYSIPDLLDVAVSSSQAIMVA